MTYDGNGNPRTIFEPPSQDSADEPTQDTLTPPADDRRWLKILRPGRVGLQPGWPEYEDLCAELPTFGVLWAFLDEYDRMLKALPERGRIHGTKLVPVARRIRLDIDDAAKRDTVQDAIIAEAAAARARMRDPATRLPTTEIPPDA